MSVNKAILIGNLGRDPELRTVAGGQTVAKFSVATSRKWKDRDGGQQEQTEWHNVVAWGRLAEICGQYLCKGSQVYIEGRLQTDSWEDKDTGQKRYRTDIVAEQMTMLGGNDRGARSGNRPTQSNSAGFDPGAEDEDIPF